MWQADSQYQDRHSSIAVPVNMTVDTWFDYWIQNIVGDLAPNMLRNYRERYKFNIQPIIGRMQLTDVKPMHCKIVLNQMDKDYAGSTIRQTYICMGTMLKSALMNDLIPKHPMDGVRYTKPVRAKSEKRNATQGFAEAFRTREYSNHHGSICARHKRFYVKGRILV